MTIIFNYNIQVCNQSAFYNKELSPIYLSREPSVSFSYYSFKHIQKIRRLFVKSVTTYQRGKCKPRVLYPFLFFSSCLVESTPLSQFHPATPTPYVHHSSDRMQKKRGITIRSFINERIYYNQSWNNISFSQETTQCRKHHFVICSFDEQGLVTRRVVY